MAELYNLPRESLIKRVRWFEKKYGPYIEKRRAKGNWKNLFRKPTMLEWVIFAMLLLGLFMGWAYQQDVAAYQQIIEDCTPNEIILNWDEDINLTFKEESNNDTGIG